MDLIKKEQTLLDTRWIEQLAIDEINMDESGVINFNDHLNPLRMLEEASIELMENLRELFEIYTTKFNQLRTHNGNESTVRIFKISNTVNDFMLYRNALKLVVARRSHDVVSIGFLSNTSGPFPARMKTSDSSIGNIHEIRAQVGPFNDIAWRFQGQEVKIDSLVRHYLTEFIKHSAK